VIEPWNRAQADDSPEPDPDTERGRSFSLKVAGRVVEAIREPFTIHGEVHAITIGIAYSSPTTPGGSTAMNAADVLEEADAAMYRAKHQGKDRVEVSAVGRNGDAGAD
jgi:GGDEF domain-containing protein